jgi:hypothetical protein
VALFLGKTPIPDGLYRVKTAHLCAGFVVEDGRVVMCAPILRARFGYWLKRAKKVKE